MAKGLDYENMKRNDFAKSRPDYYATSQSAVIGKSESGAIKVSFRGDQPVDVAIKAIQKAIKEAGHDLVSNAVIYFYPVGKPKAVKNGRVDKWEARPSAVPCTTKPEDFVDDGSLPWD